ncbi:MAG: hypothetical protein JWO40_268 [Candidatus Doudnabacteria bacterium]|nr:hypothetical protein [Candidatus Doudnabacteria bacterium]
MIKKAEITTRTQEQLDGEKPRSLSDAEAEPRLNVTADQLKKIENPDRSLASNTYDPLEIEAQLEQIRKSIQEGRAPINKLESEYPKNLDEFFMNFGSPESTGTYGSLLTKAKVAFIELFNNTSDLPFKEAFKFKLLRLINVYLARDGRTRSEADLIGIFIAHGVAKNEEDAKWWIRKLLKYNISADGGGWGFQPRKLTPTRNAQGEWEYYLEKTN